jgi:hypothetical protein
MKTLSKILLTLTAVILVSTLTFAQNTAAKNEVQKMKQTTSNQQGKFADANKNGICDNFESRGQTVKGGNFIDKNGDGVCDNRSIAGQGKGKGCGQGFQHRHGKGNGSCCGQGRGYGQGKGCCNFTK